LRENIERTIAFFQKRTAKITGYCFITNFFTTIFSTLYIFLDANLLKPFTALWFIVLNYFENIFQNKVLIIKIYNL